MRKNLKDFIDRVSNRLKGRVKEEDYPLGMEGTLFQILRI